jgi:peptide methionine sulfoxide reductase MsrA
LANGVLAHARGDQAFEDGDDRVGTQGRAYRASLPIGIVEISEAVPSWEAEAEHQDYLQHYPNGCTCHFPQPGWSLPHRQTAA